MSRRFVVQGSRLVTLFELLIKIDRRNKQKEMKKDKNEKS